MSGSIASRPSMEQVTEIVDFMEQNPALGVGKLRGLEGREESKRLWKQIVQKVNSLPGPNRSLKSWMKYWSDKKFTVRQKVISLGGDSNNLTSNIEKKIWDLFLANEEPKGPRKSSIKHEEPEAEYLEETYLVEPDGSLEPVDERVFTFETPAAPVLPVIVEDRQNAILEKLVKVMSTQATAISTLATSSRAQAAAMERLADATRLQALALDRLSNTFSNIGTAAVDIRNSLVDIDACVKRYYTSPT